jgi:hypothetical protein
MNEHVVLTGPLPPGPFAFAPTEGAADETADGTADGTTDATADGSATTVFRFETVTASGTEFDLDEVGVYISGSRFTGCTFRQDLRIAKANRQRYAHSRSHVRFGIGNRSTYRDCVFDHVDFGSAGGGAYPGMARFEGCTFRHCAFRQFDAEDAGFVDCTFVGTITSARFHGRGEFHGNDLTRAKLRRVEFRDIDLRTSKLPDGPEYLRVDGFRDRARQARDTLKSWPGAEREAAEWLLGIYEERWNEPLFVWRRALANPGSRLWQLLDS